MMAKIASLAPTANALLVTVLQPGDPSWRAAGREANDLATGPSDISANTDTGGSMLTPIGLPTGMAREHLLIRTTVASVSRMTI